MADDTLPIMTESEFNAQFGASMPSDGITEMVIDNPINDQEPPVMTESEFNRSFNQPSWGDAAKFTGQSFAEGVGKTADLASMLMPSLSIVGAPNRYENLMASLFGKPTGIEGNTADYTRAAMNAAAFPVEGPAMFAGNILSSQTGKLAEKTFPKHSAIANVLGATLPFAAYGAVKSGAKAIGSTIADLLSPTVREQVAQKAAQDIVTKVSNPAEAIAAIDSAKAADALVPLIEKKQATYLPQYRRTAEITGAPGYAAIEKSVYNTVPEAKTFIADQDLAREAARQALYKRANPTPLNASATGESISEALVANNEAIGKKVSDIAEKAFVGGEGLLTPRIKAALTSTLNKFTKDGSRTLDSKFLTLVDNFRALPKNVDLQTLQNYRSSFGDWAGAASGLNPSTVDKQTARIAGSLRDATDNLIKRTVDKGALSESQANAWNKMIETRAEKGTLFENKTTGKMLQKEPFSTKENPVFTLDDSQIFFKAIETKRSAERTVAALKGQTKSIQDLRSGLLTHLYETSTNPNTGVFNAATFKRQLGHLDGIADPILTKPQIKILSKIADDLDSQVTSEGKAYLGSKRISATTEGLSNIDMIQQAAREGVSSAAIKTLGKVPLIGGVMEAIATRVVDPAARVAMVNKTLAKFAIDPDFAKTLLQKQFETPKSFWEKLSSELIGQIPPVGSKVAVSEITRGNKEEAPVKRSEFNAAIKPKDTPVPAPTPIPSQLNNLSKEERIKKTAAFVKEQPPLIQAIIMGESSGDPFAQSPTGPRGLMQLNKATGEYYGAKDRLDPRQNVKAGTAFIQDLATKYTDPMIILAAYQAGETVVNKAIKRAGVDKKKADWESIKQYVPKISKPNEPDLWYPEYILSHYDKLTEV